MISDAKEPLAVRGGGTRGMALTGDVLSTGELSGITLYEPGALTLVARAGTPVAEIAAALAQENQRLPFEPMDFRPVLGTKGTPTIGGVVAGNNSGPRRIQAGACRDSLIGVRFVDGTGTVIKNGGRVMKNVTGYDLVKLMAGSFGTLGVLSEVSFKVLPGVAQVATLSFEGLSVAQAVAAMSAALGSPYEVSGAAHDPQTQKTSLRLEGFEASVAYRAEALVQELSKFGTASIDTEAAVAHWAAIRDLADFSDKPGDIWRISVKPSDGPRVAEALESFRLQMDWGGGLIWVCAPEGSDIRARIADIPGHATRIRGAGSGPVFHPEPPGVAALSAGIRVKFDPRGILNTGLMGAAHANDIHA